MVIGLHVDDEVDSNVNAKSIIRKPQVDHLQNHHPWDIKMFLTIEITKTLNEKTSIYSCN